jgi:hypothetical protein
MKVREIVDICGGRKEVAYRLGQLDTSSVSQWSDRGIPWKYWDALIKLAGKRAEDLTVEDCYQANLLTKKGK